jgi:hypothetical protein
MAILGRRSEHRRVPARLLAATLLASVFCPWTAAHQPSEYQVKAAFLLNFTKFVEWPAAAFTDARSPITICILGDDPFNGLLDRLVQGESVNGRKIGVQHIRRTPRPKSCQVLFIGGSEKSVASILEDAGAGVLTVGEGRGFLEDGGIIAFVTAERHVRFDINQRGALKASLTLSARLLNVARSVEK